MTERYTIFSEGGDEYRLQFTTDRSNIIADHILDRLLQDGIEVVEIGLGRAGLQRRFTFMSYTIRSMNSMQRW